MSTFTAIDLSRLPAPEVVEPLQFETILSEMKTALSERLGQSNWDQDMESEPLTRLLEVCAYREVLMRQRVNDAARQTMLAYASGSNLDNLAALLGVSRHQDEDDVRLRTRTQLALEGFSTAGPEGAYQFHVLGADSQIKDVSVASPSFQNVLLDPALAAQLPQQAMVFEVSESVTLVPRSEGEVLPSLIPGTVVVTILTKLEDGLADSALCTKIETYLNEEDVRPLTDFVRVQPAEIIPYDLDVVLTLYDGPDEEVVRANSESKVRQYVTEHHRLGHDITLSGLYAALHQPGVQRVQLNSPSEDIVCHGHQAAYLGSLTLTVGGRDE